LSAESSFTSCRPERVTSDHTFVAQAGAILFGQAGANLLAGAVALCVVGGMAAMIMLCPRVYYAMDADGVFLKSVAQLHPRLGTPVRAIGIIGVMTSLLVALGAFEQIIAYFLFVAVLFIGLTVCTLFVFRRRGRTTPVRTPGYPVTPLIFLCAGGGTAGADNDEHALAGAIGMRGSATGPSCLYVLAA
jgi:APA family basic amino acid/polyamine antiporter